MAWKKVHVRTIPNSDTPFEFMSDEGLVVTYTAVFSSEDTKNEFVSDSTISTEIARRNKINEDRGITLEVTVDEEV